MISDPRDPQSVLLRDSSCAALLPDPWRDYVQAVSVAAQVDASMPLACTLTLVSGIICDAVQVRAYRGYTQPTQLYTMIPAEAGERKSTCMSMVVDPINDLSQSLAKHGAEAEAEAEATARVLGASLRSASTAKDMTDADRIQQCQSLIMQIKDAESYAAPGLLLSNVTMERLVQVLAKWPRAILASPEGGSISVVMGSQYDSDSGVGLIDPVLHAYDCEAIIHHRVGRPTVVANRPALAVLIMPQPIAARLLLGEQSIGRGLASRFSIVTPVSLAGHRAIVSTPVADHLREWWREIVGSLAERDDDRLITWSLSDDAAEMWRSNAASIEREMGKYGAYAYHREWAAKQAARVLRVSASVHAIRQGIPLSWASSVVDDQDMRVALMISDCWARDAILFMRQREKNEE